MRPFDQPLRIRVRPVRAREGVHERVLLVQPGVTQVVVGRAPDVTVPLPFATVSDRHASLLGDGSGVWTLIDLGSTNGTFVAGHRLSPQVPVQVRPGDVVRVADVDLTLEVQPSARSAADESTATLARRLVADLFAGGGREVPRLTVADGVSAGRVFELRATGRAYKIGRSPSCDLVLDDADLSREHAALERRWEGVFVRDLGSKNGVEVNGATIQGEARLRDGARLLLGATTLVFDDPEDRYLAQLSQQPDAQVPAADAPPPRPTPVPSARRRSHVSTRGIRFVTYTAVTVIVGVTGLLLWLLLGDWR